MPTLYPLRLEPLFQQYLWGGRRLASLLGKPLGQGDTYAESWEVVDHRDGQSRVLNGPLAGQTLGELARRYPAEMYGAGLSGGEAPDRFPLLLKYLDAQKTLSVQVHPNDAQGAKLDPPDLGKTEAWLVLAAEPGAKIYAGLSAGVDRAAIAAALAEGECERCLHAFEPAVGDCVFIPAGTVHALGEGLVIAEIQQASNTTFRLFDWNRLEKDGKPRPLHVEASLDTIDYQRGPVAPQIPQPLGEGSERLVECDKFIFDRWRLSAGQGGVLSDAGGFRILTVVEGEVTVRSDDGVETLGLGQTLLAPACCSGLTLDAGTGATVLDMRLP
ncbi:type I phosphomannose isomerase catalytic subunit [Botrimarina hoheduenensis]|uniref:Putative mannose-6-phosphate isomerase GmuF n=1 Tax=Botrimarina hoheduenensis TaxID=2528000 RepID=A0A5C5VVN9_9BACT|nr:type I phosphomannose isomerase catalytic subunit [Botrimarina hoheduenensis]TWT41582.1 putative mannose-6-phosphate isomerase GmuF [Botrimarina hoheduenensis]